MAHLRAAIVSLVVLTVITGIVYPLIVTGIAQVVFPYQANGSLIVKDGKAVGSALIGQPFDDPKYFWGRPSATSPFGYNAAASSGSNLSPTNPALVKAVQERVDALRAADPGNKAAVPVDLVTASGSGLDPHISPAAALYQVTRVATGPEARAPGRPAARGAAYGGSLPRHPGGAAGERLERQPGAGRQVAPRRRRIANDGTRTCPARGGIDAGRGRPGAGVGPDTRSRGASAGGTAGGKARRAEGRGQAQDALGRVQALLLCRDGGHVQPERRQQGRARRDVGWLDEHAALLRHLSGLHVQHGGVQHQARSRRGVPVRAWAWC